MGYSAPRALPSPRGHQVRTRATPRPRVSAHPGLPRRQGEARGLPLSRPGRRGGADRGALTFSMVPGSRRSNSLQRTTPSFRDACRKPSGSEMVFLGDSSTPKVMSHVTVCSAEFIAAARPASLRREPVSAPFTSERPQPGRERSPPPPPARPWRGPRRRLARAAPRSGRLALPRVRPGRLSSAFSLHAHEPAAAARRRPRRRLPAPSRCRR